MKNVLEFVTWGLSHVKKKTVPSNAILPIDRSLVGAAGEWEYLFGTTGKTVTQSLLDRKFKDYYKKNGWSRTAYDKTTTGWVSAKKTVCDCQGVEDFFSKADTNANGNYVRYCTDKGLCSAINRPWVLGEAVFNGSNSKKTHVGWVCGFLPDGSPLFMHERGIKYGFVVTTLKQFNWKYRGLMTKRYTYEATDTIRPEVKPSTFVFTRQLKYGCKGDDVVELKKALIKEGYGKGLTVDTSSSKNFYGSTRTAVKNYQRNNGLKVDGVAGPYTYKALGLKYNL